MKLEIKDLCKSFSETEVLHGISFSVESGRALGLLGRNGAGKTTTIRILMKVFHQNSGEILLDGKEFNPNKHKIGYLPEERGLYATKKVSEQMIYLAKLRGLTTKEAKENSKKWLDKLGVLEYYDRKLDTLSKGNQQKVQLAQTLVCNPDIVILDEPFSGLDPVNAQLLKDVVNELIESKKLVIFCSHQMSYVEEFCQDIAIIDKGNLVLSGELKAIKKEFGENKLVLSSLNHSLKDLANLFNGNLKSFAKVIEVKKQFILLELNEDITKNNLLSEILKTNVDIERFSVYEPSLTDIFVKKVGEE